MRTQDGRYWIEKESRQGESYPAGRFTNKAEAIDLARKGIRQMAKGWVLRVWDRSRRQILWQKEAK